MVADILIPKENPKQEKGKKMARICQFFVRFLFTFASAIVLLSPKVGFCYLWDGTAIEIF